MSLFQCAKCGCIENTALSCRGFPADYNDIFNWADIDDVPRPLCSACGPTHYKDGRKTEFGKWHGEFPRRFLELGKWVTNSRGDLVHCETRKFPTDADYVSPPSFIEE